MSGVKDGFLTEKRKVNVGEYARMIREGKSLDDVELMPLPPNMRIGTRKPIDPGKTVQFSWLPNNAFSLKRNRGKDIRVFLK